MASARHAVVGVGRFFILVERRYGAVRPRDAETVPPATAGVMSYSPLTDFVALIRNVGNSASVARMPGLDFVVSAMARAGWFQLWTGQAPPTANQATTVWLVPSSPSWVAEGAVYLWNASTGSYVPATPALWDALLVGAFGYVFQSVTTASDLVNDTTSLLAIQRAAPVATTLTLGSVVARRGRALRIVDWSSAVAGHAITLAPASGSTIMRLTSFQLLSTPDQLAGITLHPSTDLNGWAVAP